MRFSASWSHRFPVQARSAAPVVVIAAWASFSVFEYLAQFIGQNSPVGFLWN